MYDDAQMRKELNGKDKTFQNAYRIALLRGLISLKL